MLEEKTALNCQDSCCCCKKEAVESPDGHGCSREEAILPPDLTGQETSLFDLEGLDCADCAAKLERVISHTKGVTAVSVNFATAKMKVTSHQDVVQADDIIKKVEGMGYKARPSGNAAGVKTVTFNLSGLDCADCAAELEKIIKAITGVQEAIINFGAGKLAVKHITEERYIIAAIEKAGYTAEPEGRSVGSRSGQNKWWRNRKTVLTVVSGALLLAAAILEWLDVSLIAPQYLFALSAAIGIYYPAKAGFYGLRSWTFDMNLLMTAAVVGAAIIGEWSEAATVTFLFCFGNALQAYTMDKTRRSIRALMDITPAEALVRRGADERKLPVGEIVVGDVIIVKAGERIAMDGIVKAGISAVNQATITGESRPVDKNAGDEVYAGTINGYGVLEIEVTKVASDSTLAKIMHLVEQAQAQRAPSQQFVDKFSKYYTPAVLLAAAGVMIIPWGLFNQPLAPWFYKGLVLLVIACPCALVISTPVSIVAAIGNASRRGVLVKGGAYLERLGSVQAMAFDKTGTLTTGQPIMTDIYPESWLAEHELLTIAGSIENRSEHTLAQAIVAAALKMGIALKPVANFATIIGRGAKADIDGQTFYIGSARLFAELGHKSETYQVRVAGLEEQGKTVMLVGTKDKIYGSIAVADGLRDNSVEAISELRKVGIRHIAILTGDNGRVAAAIADATGVDAYHSELMPQDKVAAIKKIVGLYGDTVMVGDGVNDAPALAVATVGVAMGVAGSDTALETADVALMADDLSKLTYVIRLGRKTIAIIKQNITFAILMKIAFILLTFVGVVNLWLAVFADMGASLLVTLNGMRLMRKLV